MPKLLHPRPHRILLLGRVCELEKPDKAIVASAEISDEEADHLEETADAHKGYKVVRGATKQASTDLLEEAAAAAAPPAAEITSIDALSKKSKKGAK